MDIYVINGPNLNLIGQREPEIYGTQSLDEFLSQVEDTFDSCTFDFFQSNSEGEIINYIHSIFLQKEKSKDKMGVIINGGAYSHTSIAIADALRVLDCPKVEVHISNVYQRESYRHSSYLSSACDAVISGMGLWGYRAAINWIINKD